MASFLSRGLGTLFLILFPPVKQKLTYTVGGFIQASGFAIMCLAHLYPEHHWPILIVGTIFYGSGRAVFMIPFILVSHFFRAEAEQKYLSLWYATNYFTRVFSYSLIFYLQSKFHWTQCMLIVGGSFICFTILNHLIIPEVEAVAGGGGENSNGSFTFLKEYLRNPRQFLLTADFYLNGFISGNLMMWTPYYLDAVGVKNYAIILVMTGIFFANGSVFMECLISLCPAFTRVITSTYVLFTMLLHVYWLLIP